MFIGPLWCIESKAWLRFNRAEDGQIIGEVALIDADNPLLTMAWQTVSAGTWHVLHEKEHQYYCLQKGILYRHDGVDNIRKTTNISMCSKDTPDWRRISAKANPFGEQYGLVATLPDNDLRPLTPEEQDIKWLALRQKNLLNAPVISEFNQEQCDELMYCLPQALIGFDATNYPTYDGYLAALREVICNPNNRYNRSLVEQAAKTFDYPSLENSQITHLPLKKKQFFFNLLTNAYNYIRTQFGLPVEPLTEDIAAPVSAQSLPFRVTSEDVEQRASETIPLELMGGGFRRAFIDELTESMFSNAQRLDLLIKMEQSIPDFFTINHNDLEKYYDDLHQVINNNENGYHQIIQFLSLSDDTRADRELNDLGAGTISAAKLEFFFDVLRGEYDTVGHKIGMAYNAIAIPSDAPLARPQSPHSEHLSRRLQQPAIDDSEAAEPLTEEIKRAVTSAQAKYAEWSLDSSLYPHRGPNGFFSWARHGAYGQTRAKKFMEIITTMDEEANITAAINGYLLDDKTRYHRHSFASFLLDELKAIKRLPYLNLAYAPSSNLYDKNVVIAGLVSSEGLCQTGQMPHQC